MRLNKDLLVVIFLFVPIISFAQTKDELKEQKSELEKEIRYTTQLLNKTKSNKTKSLDYLKVLKRQIKSKEQLLATLQIEISLLNKKINKTEVAILESLKELKKEELNLNNLKNEYAKMIYAVFKQKGKRNKMIFIISSSDFNQAYKRVLYLRQYSIFRKNQAKKIEEGQKELIKKKESLATEKHMLTLQSAKQTALVETKKEELISISAIKNEKQNIIKKLSKSENFFKNELKLQQQEAKELEGKIRKIIKEEIAKTKKENINNSYRLTPEALALSSEFANNKGKLPWPLEKGVIVSSYGKQEHFVFAGIETFNNGIDIATNKNTKVRTVFDGTVSRIFFIKGEGKAVLINHGEFFSVYSGLKEVMVKAGEKVLSKEKIGVVMTQEAENKTELHFEIWKGYEKRNPSEWLYRAY